jgi:chromosomal replication initiation ATPase DnaA
MREINFTDDEIIKLKYLINTINPGPKSKFTIITLKKIQTCVCIAHNISIEDLTGKIRTQPYVMARIDFCYLAYKYITQNKTKIAKAIGRNHNSGIGNLLKKTPSLQITKIQKILFNAS